MADQWAGLEEYKGPVVTNQKSQWDGLEEYKPESKKIDYGPQDWSGLEVNEDLTIKEFLKNPDYDPKLEAALAAKRGDHSEGELHFKAYDLINTGKAKQTKPEGKGLGNAFMGAVNDIAMSIAKPVEKAAIELPIQLTGFEGFKNTPQENVAELAAAGESGLEGFRDLARRGIRHVSDGSYETKPLEERRKRFFEDAQKAYELSEIQSGRGAVADTMGVKGEDVDPENVRQMSMSPVFDPSSAITLGAGAAIKPLARGVLSAVSTGGKGFKAGRIVQTASTLEKIKPFYNKAKELGEAAVAPIKSVTGSGIEKLGKGFQAVGRATEDPLKAGLITGGVTLLGTDDVGQSMQNAFYATIGVGSLKGVRIGRGLTKTGETLEDAGRRMGGKPSQQLFDMPSNPGLLSGIGGLTKKVLTSDITQGAAVGSLFALPFLPEAKNADEAAQMIFTSGGFGVLGAIGAKRSVNAASAKVRGELIARAPKEYGTTFEGGSSFDALHNDTISRLPKDRQESIQEARGLFPNDEIYVLPRGEIEKVFGVDAPGVVHQRTTVDGQTKNVVFLQDDLIALGHETGHLLEASLDPAAKADLRGAVEANYGPEGLQRQADVYAKRLAINKGILKNSDFMGDQLRAGLGLDKVRAYDEMLKGIDPVSEIISENMGYIADGRSLADLATPKPLLQAFGDAVNAAGEKIGMRAKTAVGLQGDIPTQNLLREQVSTLAKEPVEVTPLPVAQEVPVVVAPKPTELSFEDAKKLSQDRDDAILALKAAPKTGLKGKAIEEAVDAAIAEAQAAGISVDAGAIYQRVVGGKFPQEKAPIVPEAIQTPKEAIPEAPKIETIPATPEVKPMVAAPLTVERITEIESAVPEPPRKMLSKRHGKDKTQEALDAERAEQWERDKFYAVAQEHAKGVTDRRAKFYTDPDTGKQGVSGDFLDPNDPFHQKYLSNLDDTAKAYLAQVEDGIANKKAVDSIYGSAPETSGQTSVTAGERREAQKIYTAKGRIAGTAELEWKPKTFVPLRINLRPDGSIDFYVFSVDKHIGGLEKALGGPKGKNIPVVKQLLNHPKFAEDLAGYYANQANGWRGDGSAPLKSTDKIKINVNPDYVPYVMDSSNTMDLLNLSLGVTDAIYGEKGPTTAKAKDLSAFADLNAKPDLGRGERNPLRSDIARATKEVDDYNLKHPELVKSIPNGDYKALVDALLESMNKDRAKGEKTNVYKAIRNVIEDSFETLKLDLMGEVQPQGGKLRGTAFEGDPKELVKGGIPNRNTSKIGFMPESEDYRGNHTAPMRDSGSPLHDLTGTYPDDIYSSNAARYYGHYGDYRDNRAVSLMQQYKGKPNAIVTVYRAVPKVLTNAEKINDFVAQKAYIQKHGKTPPKANTSLDRSKYYEFLIDEIEKLQSLPEVEKQDPIKINAGDWVTLDRSYAKEHGESSLNGEYKIVSRKVKAKELFTDGNSINEFGYDPDSSSPKFMPKTDTWYSQLEKTIEGKMPNRANIEQLRNIIDPAKGSGIKADEIKWTGLDDFLKDKTGLVTKEEVLKHIRDNAVEVEEVVKGGEVDAPDKFHNRQGELGQEIDEALSKVPSSVKFDDIQAWIEENDPKTIDLQTEYRENQARIERAKDNPRNQTKFSNFQTPGGENYRELLLTLPEKPKPNYLSANQFFIELNEKYGANFTEKATNEELSRLNSLQDNLKSVPPNQNFKSSHYDEPNILAHVRFNERTVDGNKVLFIEEVQSDWHQKGRKEGYSGLPTTHYYIDVDGNPKGGFENRIDAESRLDFFKKEFPDSQVTIKERSGKTDSGVPDAPFSKTWHELAMKRMLRYATENGFDKVAWTTGEQQAARYDLSKHIQEIILQKGTGGKEYLSAYDHNGKRVIDKMVTPDDLSEHIGKEAADKLNTQEWKPYDSETASGSVITQDSKRLSGLELKVGGEGMKGFYDQILPSFMNKYGKKWNAKVDRISLGDEAYHDSKLVITGADEEFYVNRTNNGDVGDEVSGPFKSEFEAERAKEKLDNQGDPGNTVHSIDITPSMKESVMQGQTQFMPKERDLRGIELKSKKKSLEGITLGSKDEDMSNAVEPFLSNGTGKDFSPQFMPSGWINRSGEIEKIDPKGHAKFVADNPDFFGIGKVGEDVENPTGNAMALYDMAFGSGAFRMTQDGDTIYINGNGSLSKAQSQVLKDVVLDPDNGVSKVVQDLGGKNYKTIYER